MNILFVVSEAVPLVKSGGLGEYAGSLPKTLASLGVDVRVMLPAHEEIAGGYRCKFREAVAGTLKMGGELQHWRLLEADVQGIHYYLLENAHYFGRRGLYGYDDETERYVFYCLAAALAIRELAFQPDIIHCHDWQTALLPALLERDAQVGNYAHIPSILTIHNMHYQGKAEKAQFRRWLGLRPGEEKGLFLPLQENQAGSDKEWVSCLELGLTTASRVTTVSPSYADEIAEEPLGAGLSHIVRQRWGGVRGICNGIDTVSYDPTGDPAVPYPYASWRGKRLNKAALQRRLGLREDAGAPLFAIVSRLVWQKGLDLVISLLEQLVARGIQLAVIGAGEAYYESVLHSAATQYPGSLSVHTTFEDSLARQFYAGADFLLMPSLYEPCGISQRIALQYRTIPIVRLIGGLKDTIVPFDPLTGQGSGFAFEEYHPEELLAAVDRALQTYHDRNRWDALHTSIAALDLSWQSSASAYLSTYLETVISSHTS
ncbi:glycogen synthase [Paenibacillus sp. GCM10012307]|uniref:Glycogen synthase n=1 Tax=Paenibacillus roseus TaxID=2798579 RepID=A0A934J3X0_9BACL|nr:glycogen synthase [Paenibacillus roseus]MBJ6364277.1 glycogen synthase [Paenibacillus roseus]